MSGVNYGILYVSNFFFVFLDGLLDILSGHEGPVHGLTFSPTNVSQLALPFLSAANKVEPCHMKKLNPFLMG